MFLSLLLYFPEESAGEGKISLGPRLLLPQEEEIVKLTFIGSIGAILSLILAALAFKARMFILLKAGIAGAFVSLVAAIYGEISERNFFKD